MGPQFPHLYNGAILVATSQPCCEGSAREDRCPRRSAESAAQFQDSHRDTVATVPRRTMRAGLPDRPSERGAGHTDLRAAVAGSGVPAGAPGTCVLGRRVRCSSAWVFTTKETSSLPRVAVQGLGEVLGGPSARLLSVIWGEAVLWATVVGPRQKPQLPFLTGPAPCVGLGRIPRVCPPCLTDRQLQLREVQ